MENVKGVNSAKKKVAFCIIYCDDSRPYKDYDAFLESNCENDKKKAKLKIPMIMAMMRNDCTIGFPGGHIKDNESIIDGLKRELKEEINLNDLDESRLKILCTYYNDRRIITTFHYKVTYEEYNEIFRNSINSKHLYSENCGLISLQVHKNSLRDINLNHFCGGNIKSEINLLVHKEKLIKPNDKRYRF